MVYKRSHRKKERISRFRVFLLVMASGLILIFTLKTLQLIHKAVWDGQSRINLIIDAGDIFFTSFDPKEEKILVVSVPPQTYIEAPYGYGSYPFGAIYNLGEIEKKGGEVLSLSAQEFFAVPIDAWIKMPPGRLNINDEGSAKRQLVNLFQNFSWLLASDGIIKSNLTILDRSRLWWQIRQVRADKVVSLRLPSVDVMGDSVSSEGSDGKFQNLSKLDNSLSSYLTDQEIREESLKIGILNSTGESGLGNRVGRLINNLGGVVIDIGNQDQQLDHCLIKTKKENINKKTVQHLRKIFSCKLEENDLLESRVDVIFIVGRDYWQKLNAGK